MSDVNPDVAPQESVVDSPDNYEATTEETTATVEPEATEELDEPVSLDEAPEAEEPESVEEPTETETDEAETEEGEEPEAVEMREFDFGGNKLEVPKDSLPPEVADKVDQFTKDLWADYTKKSQANAETAKAYKARTEALDKIESLGGEALDAFTRGKSIKSELEQLEAVNMQALWQSNPDKARQLTDLKAQKSAELGEIIQAVDNYEAQLGEARQAEMSRLSQEGEATLNRKYKGFTEKVAPKLEQYAQEKYGMSAEDAAQWRVNPVMTEMAYKAMLYDQMQQKTAPKPTTSKANPVKAMKSAGKAKGPSNPNNMGFTELGKVLGIK